MRTAIAIVAALIVAFCPVCARAQSPSAGGDDRLGRVELRQHVESTITRQARLRCLRLKRWSEQLEARLRCVRKEIVLDRHLLVQMQRLFSPRISPSYYTNLAEVYAALEKAMRLERRLSDLIAMADRERRRERAYAG